MNRESLKLAAEIADPFGDLEDLDEACGFVVEVITSSGYCQLVGPYAKDSAAAFAAIERLQSEEDREQAPNTYKLRLLFPATSTIAPGAC